MHSGVAHLLQFTVRQNHSRVDGIIIGTVRIDQLFGATQANKFNKINKAGLIGPAFFV